MNRICVYIAAAACTLLWLPASAFAVGQATRGGGAAFEQPVVSAPQGAFAGRSARVVGVTRPAAGRVTIETRLGSGGWSVAGTAPVDSGGSFETVWTPPKAGRYEFRFTPVGAPRAANAAADGALSVYRLQKATWYGPGFYGRRTACGTKLTRRTQGVAHKSLPCGTAVELFVGGRRAVVRVIDRGPFVRGVAWDLTYATAKSLDSLRTVQLGALPLN
ncbi:MAG: septal ring lytic transglycosylase RlpA family protein [Solirubrobacterales bacterium]